MAKRKNKLSEPIGFWSGVIIGAVGFFVVTNIGFLLKTVNWQRALSSVKNEAKVTQPIQKNSHELDQVQIGKQFNKAGYLITWSNPRYEFDEESLTDTFKVDVNLNNVSFEPLIRMIANCDIVDMQGMVKEGVGVRIDAEENHLDPGERIDVTIVTPLEIDYDKESQTFSDDRDLPGGHVSLFPDRKVSSCSFSPTGSYDSNIAVKVLF